MKRIVIPRYEDGRAVRAKQLDDNVRKIAEALAGGLDVGSLNPLLKFSAVAANAGALRLPEAWAEGRSAVYVSMLKPQGQLTTPARNIGVAGFIDKLMVVGTGVDGNVNMWDGTVRTLLSPQNGGALAYAQDSAEVPELLDPSPIGLALPPAAPLGGGVTWSQGRCRCGVVDLDTIVLSRNVTAGQRIAFSVPGSVGVGGTAWKLSITARILVAHQE